MSGTANTPATEADFEALREVECAWIAEHLGKSIANLGYPVGCGNAPLPKSLERAAGILFDRYLTMFKMVRQKALADAEGRQP